MTPASKTAAQVRTEKQEARKVLFEVREHYAKLLDGQDEAAKAFEKAGVKRLDYYSGDLQGNPGTLFTEKVGPFCAYLFHTEHSKLGKRLTDLPSTVQLDKDLRELGNLYSGAGVEDGKGLDYYLRNQEIWTPEDGRTFRTLSEKFHDTLTKAFWRPPKNTGNTMEIDDPDDWKQPLLKPKLHTLCCHVADFPECYGYLGKFSEESFEHFQQVSKKYRAEHADNRTKGGQIVEDMQYCWLHVRSFAMLYGLLHKN